MAGKDGQQKRSETYRYPKGDLIFALALAITQICCTCFHWVWLSSILNVMYVVLIILGIESERKVWKD